MRVEWAFDDSSHAVEGTMNECVEMGNIIMPGYFGGDNNGDAMGEIEKSFNEYADGKIGDTDFISKVVAVLKNKNKKEVAK